MNIKYVSAQEYGSLKRELELTMTYSSSMLESFKEGFIELQVWDEHSSQPMFVRIAPTPLMEELV